MAIVELFGTNRTIPDDGATDWGADVRETLVSLAAAVNTLATMVGSQAFLVLNATQNSYSANGTVSVLTPRHDLTSTSGANKITSVSAGTKNGQTLLLVGGQANTSSNYVYLEEDTTNTVLNGIIQLKAGVAVFLMWDTTRSTDAWIEISRSN